MRIVGLTGGIASGKSTVSNLFKANGVPIVDADLIARKVVEKGTGGWKKVVQAFGEDVLQVNGEIDRKKLGQLVFVDPAKRKLLNQLLAPYISSGIFWNILKMWMKGYKVIVLDVPLLFEAKMDKWTKPIIVVWVDPETQLRRLVVRDGSSEDDASNRIKAQMPLDLKRVIFYFARDGDAVLTLILLVNAQTNEIEIIVFIPHNLLRRSFFSLWII